MVVALQADPLGDLSTELERELGKLVKAKYKTDFYMLYNYPLAVSTPASLPASSAPLHPCNQWTRSYLSSDHVRLLNLCPEARQQVKGEVVNTDCLAYFCTTWHPEKSL